MLKTSTSKGPELLSGITKNDFSHGAGGFSHGGDSHAAQDQLHFAMVEICKAIVGGKITATAYVTALMEHAERQPSLARFVTQIEARAIATARKIDETLSNGRMLPPGVA